MKIANLFLCASLSLAVVGGCKKGGGGDTAEKMVTMTEELGNAVEKAGDDCGKMASAVEAVANKYDLKALKADADKLKADKEQSKKIMEKYGDRMKAVMPKLMGMMKCADDPKMKAVNDKFQGVL
jgi:hypothetical protein